MNGKCVCMYLRPTVFAQSGKCRRLSQEVHHDNVQDDVGQNEVGESALRSDAEELGLVLRVGLQAQAD